MNNSQLKKRFIAGASCPQCGELDKIALYCDESRPDNDYVACVRCDYKISQQDVLNLAKDSSQTTRKTPPLASSQRTSNRVAH